jgi:hypothetical protein
LEIKLDFEDCLLHCLEKSPSMLSRKTYTRKLSLVTYVTYFNGENEIRQLRLRDARTRKHEYSQRRFVVKRKKYRGRHVPEKNDT